MDGQAFAFATCAIGVEAALKREVALLRPELRFAYSRPGLVTFRSPGAIAPDDAPVPVFARVWGVSHGAAGTPDDARARLAELSVDRVHVFRHDVDTIADVPPAAAREAVELAPWLAGARATGEAQPGELVGDVIVAAGEPAWLGVHRHDPSRPALPGGTIAVDLPADAPSRAFAKCEEAIAWARLPVARGHVALELGAAPGGAVYALARRGVHVIAVDPGALAPNVLALPGVQHLPIKAGALRWEQLPPRVDWLLVDMNLAPQVAVHETLRFAPPLRRSLRGAIITLKLNDWAFVDELPALAARLAGGLELPHVRMRHLPSNRREICVVATREP